MPGAIQLASNDGLGGVRGQGDDVGGADGGLEVRHGARPRMPGGQRLGVLGVERGDADLVEVAHERQQPQVVLGLHAGADDGGDAGVRAGEQVGGEHGGRARAQRGDRGAVHEARAGAGLFVVEPDRRQVRGQPAPRLPSNTVTTLTVMCAPCRCPGIPSRNASSGMASSLRPGAAIRPALRSRKPERSASSSSRRSSRRSTSARLNTRTSMAPAKLRCGRGAECDANARDRDRNDHNPGRCPIAWCGVEGDGGHGPDGTASITTEKDAIRTDCDAARHHDHCASCATSSPSPRS